MTIAQATACFQRLVQIPSVTGTAHEKDAAAYLGELLDTAGIPYERYEKTPGRVNLLASLKADAPFRSPVCDPLVLISHIDVAPVDESKWTHPPFCGEVFDGRIVGRGTLDTKHLTIMELYSFLKLSENRKHLRCDVHFIATIDEEKGSTQGMAAVKEAFPELFGRGTVLNEGGGFPMCIGGRDYITLTVGEKGVCRIRLTATGQGGHASTPHDDQALPRLCKAVEAITAREANLPQGARQTYQAMRALLGEEEPDNATAADILRYSGQSSISLRNYRMGERSNVIPALTEVDMEFRLLPGVSQADMIVFLDEAMQGQQATYRILSFEPGFECVGDSLAAMVTTLRDAAKKFGFPCEVLPMLALGRTDGRFFGQEGCTVYGISPVLPADSFDRILPTVHGHDESISAEGFTFGCLVLHEMIQAYCMP